jgi:hypothetical protein
VGLSGLRGRLWWVSVGGLARSGSGWVAGCFLVDLWGGSRWWNNSWSALGGSEMSVCGCGSVFGGNEICVSYL